MLVILRFQTSNMFISTPTLCFYHVYNQWCSGKFSFTGTLNIVTNEARSADRTAEGMSGKGFGEGVGTSPQIGFFYEKVNCQGYVINLSLFDITDLELVRIDTKIKFVSCIQPKITKVI